MIGIARVGDIGQGVCRAGHIDVPKGLDKSMTTELITGSPNVFMNGLAVALLGSIGATDCGHHTEALCSSPTIFVNGIPVHRLGDAGIVTDDGGGDYIMITSSPSVSE